MGNQRSGDTKSGYVYMVVWGEQVIPMMKMPQIGTVAIFEQKTGVFVTGSIQWSMEHNQFVFTGDK